MGSSESSSELSDYSSYQHGGPCLWLTEPGRHEVIAQAASQVSRHSSSLSLALTQYPRWLLRYELVPNHRSWLQVNITTTGSTKPTLSTVLKTSCREMKSARGGLVA